MLKVLSTANEIAEARTRLREHRLDTTRWLRRKLFVAAYTARYRAAPPPIATNKSWDVWSMYETLTGLFPTRRAAVADFGSFNSEIPVVLYRSGFHDITAIDLNPAGASIRWCGAKIKFCHGDFYEAALPAHSFDAITALSTIEHGYDRTRLCRTLSGLLRHGGVACISTDYHDEDLGLPRDCRLFGLPYLVFNRREIDLLLDEAARHGLAPLGELDWRASAYPISWLGRQMTFLYLCLRKVG